MLPRKFRLTKKSDFQKVFKTGKKFSGRYYLLSVLFDENLANPKVGIVVSNKISKKAVERNRIKRLLREVVQGYVSEISKKASLVFLAKKPVLEASGEDVANEVKYLFKKGDIYS